MTTTVDSESLTLSGTETTNSFPQQINLETVTSSTPANTQNDEIEIEASTEKLEKTKLNDGLQDVVVSDKGNDNDNDNVVSDTGNDDVDGQTLETRFENEAEEIAEREGDCFSDDSLNDGGEKPEVEAASEEDSTVKKGDDSEQPSTPTETSEAAQPENKEQNLNHVSDVEAISISTTSNETSTKNCLDSMEMTNSFEQSLSVLSDSRSQNGHFHKIDDFTKDEFSMNQDSDDGVGDLASEQDNCSHITETSFDVPECEKRSQECDLDKDLETLPDAQIIFDSPSNTNLSDNSCDNDSSNQTLNSSAEIDFTLPHLHIVKGIKGCPETEASVVDLSLDTKRDGSSNDEIGLPKEQQIEDLKSQLKAEVQSVEEALSSKTLPDDKECAARFSNVKQTLCDEKALVDNSDTDSLAAEGITLEDSNTSYDLPRFLDQNISCHDDNEHTSATPSDSGGSPSESSPDHLEDNETTHFLKQDLCDEYKDPARMPFIQEQIQTRPKEDIEDLVAAAKIAQDAATKASRETDESSNNPPNCLESKAETTTEGEQLKSEAQNCSQSIVIDGSQACQFQEPTVCMSSPNDPTIKIEGNLYSADYLGSTQLSSEGRPSKSLRMLQAQEAIGCIKAPEGESQPTTEVRVFVSTERILVLNTNLCDVMMDHSLRSISYIADIGDVVVLMARRNKPPPTDSTSSEVDSNTPKAPPQKMVCHVFQSKEAQEITHGIGQAFQTAYRDFLRANNIEEHSFLKKMNYQDVLATQEIFNDEVPLFSSEDKQREVVIKKNKGEILGIVVVESGWGSMIPTVVIANISPLGVTAKCGQINIGDQILAINDTSLVGLPLATSQSHIKAAKSKPEAKLLIIPCTPVVEVRLKRPDVRCPLGFSVQDGVICKLLRGGLAERCGVRFGHRIIEIDGSSMVAVAHEKIVAVLANSVGVIEMKTMPLSIFRLLTGQDIPQYI